MELTKTEREAKAVNILEKEYNDILPDFINLLKEYELKNLKEARFVYSLDKIQPIIQVVME
jgi:5'-deoxynucleotidase YfbR-like HD superfamily hydrolase